MVPGGHGWLYGDRQLDVLQLHQQDVDAPSLSASVEDGNGFPGSGHCAVSLSGTRHRADISGRSRLRGSARHPPPWGSRLHRGPGACGGARAIRPVGKGRTAPVHRVRGSAPGAEHRCTEPPGSGAPGPGQRAVRHGESLALGLFAAQAQRCADVHVESWAAQRSGEQSDHLFDRAAGRQYAGSGLSL